MIEATTRECRREAIGPHTAAAPGRAVAFHRNGGSATLLAHELASGVAVAKSLADLLGLEFAGAISASALDELSADGAHIYLVPSDTLTDPADARRLGVHGPDDLFGGVVPFPFAASPVITHPLVHADAAAPANWCAAFGEQVRQAVLHGFSVFSAADARLACARLMQHGAVRVKQATDTSGSGQRVVDDLDALDAHLEAIDSDALRRHGLVLEQNLCEAQTCSVGQVRVGRWLASYMETRSLTRNHRGEAVCGGSALRVVRGGFAELLQIAQSAGFRTAVEQAMRYDTSARACFAGMFASRSHYRVVQGRDRHGRWRSGVIEPSWRIGGASGAEVAALQAFDADPGLPWVDASTHEVYAEDAKPPPGAQVYYDGIDPVAGRILKYARVQTDVHA